ncbi:unnamed protein product [Ophioblennius macclurei]
MISQTPRTPSRRVLFLAGVMAGIAVVTLMLQWMIPLLLWGQGHLETHNSSRVKRQHDGVTQHRKPCDPEDTHIGMPVVFVSRNKSSVVIVPLSALGIVGQVHNPWYMTNDQRDTSWGTLVADPKGHDWKSYTTTQWAKYHRKIMNITSTPTSLMIGVDLRGDVSINPPGRNPQGKDCWLFLPWEWRKGRDRSFLITICSCFNESDATPERPMNQHAKDRGVRVVAEGQVTTDDWFRITTGITAFDNNWLLMAEQAAAVAKSDCLVCMGARPLLQVVPAPIPDTCVIDVMNHTNPSTNCTEWDIVFPLTADERRKPLFSNRVAANNYTCVTRIGKAPKLGVLRETQCSSVINISAPFLPQSRSDIWWWCGEDKLYDRWPRNTTGTCALITLLLPVSVVKLSVSDLLLSVESVVPGEWHRTKRSNLGWDDDDPTYIDSIGVPRGVPDEYKLTNQISSGWESAICPWCTINKNVDRINYIHYNVQKLGNRTAEGFTAVHEQLSATSLMAFQNRIAVDMLLAEKGGVCAIFGDQCCTFIPNNTAADGKLTRALEGLRSLNMKMKEHSGVDTSVWSPLDKVFGRWSGLIKSALLSIAVFTAMLVVCGCCCIPCIRALCTRLVTTAIQPMKAEMYALLPGREDPDYQPESDGSYVELRVINQYPYDDISLEFPDLYPNPWDYDG